MRAAVWHGGRDIRIENFPKPTVGPGEVLIRVRAVGLCGTELHAFEGVSKRRKPPLVMGHELAGVVEEIGKGVKEVVTGMRITVNPAVFCGVCEECLSGRTNTCAARQHIGIDFPGAFADYVKVPSRVCFEIPESISFKEATLAEPMSIGTHTASVGRIRDGDVVMVIGSGPIGLSCLIAARDKAKMTIVTDMYDSRLEFAKMLGADAVINVSKTDPVNEVRKMTSGRGVDVAIEAVGVEKTVSQAIASVGNGGRVAIVGLLDEIARVNLLEIVLKQVELRGSYGRTKDDFRRALELLKKDLARVGRLVTHTFPLESIVQAFDMMSSEKSNVMKIVLIP